jgi:hypothetical protein
MKNWHKEELKKEIESVVRITKQLNLDSENALVKARAQNNAWVNDPDQLTDYELQVIVHDAYGLPSPIAEVAESEDAPGVLYPLEIFHGTLAGEFAERCRKGNNISKELFIESFLTVLGAVVGNQLRGDQKGMCPRQYTIAVAPPQSGKDVANDEAQEIFRGAEDFDADVAGFLSHQVDYKNIGAKPVNFASENGAIDAGLECPRLLNAPPEFGSLLDKSGIVGAGQALLELMLAAWDSTFPKLSTAKGRNKVPARLFLSILTSIQPDRLGAMQVTSGLYSRCVWVAVPPLDVVASLPKVEYGDFQKKLFAKLLPLEKEATTITTTPEAVRALDEWFATVKARSYEDDQIRTRINTSALRKALVLAWLRDEVTITTDVMGMATRWCDWQLNVRSDLFLRETDNPLACMQEKIRKALRKKGSRTRDQLKRDVNGSRAGTRIFNDAVNGLVSEVEVVELTTARRNTKLYALAKGEHDV